MNHERRICAVFCVPEVAPRILLEAFYVTSIWSGTFHCIAEHYCPSTT